MGAAALDALRARIRALEGAPAVERVRLPCGVSAVDGLLGGLPVPGIVELSGPEGAGRARVALALAARICRQGGRVAWVDPLRRLYPPAAEDLGVPLDRLLVVRPTEDGSAPWAWATEQLLRSGCFRLVVVDHPAHNVRERAFSHAWARAAEHGGAIAVVLAQKPLRALPADVRLAVGGGRLFVSRDRAGTPGRSGSLPELADRCSPWGAPW